jgi:putative addiction module CopG family antidote
MTRPLPSDLETYAEARVAAGEYATVDDALRAAFALLRDHDAKRARLKAMLDEGYRSAREEPTCSVEEAIAEFDAMLSGDTQTPE